MSKDMFFNEREEEYLMDRLIMEADMIEQQQEFMDVPPEPIGTLIWSSRKLKNRWKIFKAKEYADFLPF